MEGRSLVGTETPVLVNCLASFWFRLQFEALWSPLFPNPPPVLGHFPLFIDG